LKARSRDLTQNNTYARRAVQAIANNTVGTGIQPVCENIEGKNSERLMKYWRSWAHNRVCDFDGLTNFWGLQKMVMRMVVQDGEVIIRKRATTDKKYPLKLQVVSSDFIDSSRDESIELSDGGGYITQGFEFNKDGQRVAVFLFDRHPSERYAESKRVSLTDCIHVFLPEFAGQVRGVPWSSASMRRLKDYDDYEDAELVRQKIAACYMGFITDPQGSATAYSTQENIDVAERFEPGMIEVLSPGKTIEFASPPVTQGYSDYARKVLQGAAAGYGISYEVLTGDLSGVNFSSGRMGWLEFQRNINEWQSQMLIPMFCDVVWDWFSAYAAVKGVITQNQREEILCMWTAPRREMIDPSKEVKAKSDEIRSGLISWSEAIRQNGGDPDDVAEELGEDYARFDKYGLKLACDPRWDAGKGPEAAETVEAATSDQDSE
jgi:lambda family phage portal protein